MPVTIKNYDVIDGQNNFDNTNLIEEFDNNNKICSLDFLLAELHNLSQEKINRLEDELSITQTSTAKAIVQKELNHYKIISKATQGWTVDDLAVTME